MTAEVHEQASDLIRDYFDAVDGGRVDDVLACFTDDATLRHPLADEPVAGREGLRDFYAGLDRAYAEPRHELGAIVAAGDWAACEIVFTASLREGGAVRFETCNVHRLQDGRFASLRIYGDALSMKRQLGLPL